MVYRLQKPPYLSALLVGVVLYLTLGLIIVGRYAASEARKVAHQQTALQNYNSNKAACGIRKLVDLPTQQKLLATYQSAKDDPKLDANAKKRNEQRIATTKKQIKNGRQAISLFGKIPPDYDCSKLPKHAPKVGD